MLKIQFKGIILISVGLSIMCLGGIFFQTRYYHVLESAKNHAEVGYQEQEINRLFRLKIFNKEFDDMGQEIAHNPLKYKSVLAKMAWNATEFIGKICQDWKHNKYEKYCDLSSSCDVQNILLEIIPRYFNLYPTLGYYLRHPVLFDELLDIYKKYFNAKGSCFYPKKEYVKYGIHETILLRPKSMLLTHEKVLPKIVEKFDEFIVTSAKCEIEKEEKMVNDFAADLIQQQIMMTIVHRFFCYAINDQNLAFYDYLFEIFVKLSTIPILALIFFFKPIIPFTIAFVIHTFFSIIWITILGRCKKHFKSDLWIWKIIENSKIENIKEQKRMKKKNKKENKPKRGKKSSKYFVLRSHL